MLNHYALGSVEVSLGPQERFGEYLQSRGMRNTEPRRILVDRIFSHHEHFDADTLIEQLPSKNEQGYVSRATVYRTLDELVEAGLLRKMDLKGRTVFEHDYGYPQHDHLHCTKCDRLIEFQSAELRVLRDAVASDQHFRVSGHRFIVSGTCEECVKSIRRQRRPVDLI
ncbi:MAG: transcriptional repressor [Planctomycetaceae bacterium]|nr:transcriptional repressor [Planctomycetaceae bacterium]MBP63388.1 transcriptional repressor [Planctomycetaceae bacterium]